MSINDAKTRELFNAISSKKKSAADIEGIINNGANVNTWNEQGHTPLHVAIHNHRPEILKLLIEKGARINEMTRKRGRTPLHSAIKTNHFEMVKILVDKGANLTIKTSNGKTPAQLASVKANRAVIQIIEQRSTSVKPSPIFVQDTQTISQFSLWSAKMVELTNESTKLKNEVSKLSEDLNQMAIKNLKLEDSKAFRDFERNQNFNSLRKEIGNCCICLDSQAEYAVIKCGHVCLCSKCSQSWQKRPSTPFWGYASESQFQSCPVCNQAVETVVKLYF